MTPSPSTTGAALPRVVGVGGAVMMGLGSIIGTGVFVTLGIAAGLAGPAVILAIALAAVIAAANGLSSAQLAANHPVSGGAYEYGHRHLHPSLGFTAGWMFLCAKSASAATAALGFAQYAMTALEIDHLPHHHWLALVLVTALTAIVLAGARRSNHANILIVSITLGSLLFFIAICLPRVMENSSHIIEVFFPWDPEETRSQPGRLLEATALMFVAYTGYGRIATLGEEIHEPRKSIPKAIIITLLITMTLYMVVAWCALAADPGFGYGTTRDGAPLATIARQVAGHWAGHILTLGAITAMIGVLLNLILGLSRVALAMGRRGDLPQVFGQLNATGQTPSAAVIFVGCIIACLVLIGDVKTTWSFSAFTVLIYYAITNLAALRLKQDETLYPRWIAVVGLLGCVFLAFRVEPRIWMIGLAIIAIGLLWHLIARAAASRAAR